MAKRSRNHQVTASFHYLVKGVPDDDSPEGVAEEGFTEREFARVVARLRDTEPLDDTDDEVVSAIKFGNNLPFNYYEEPARGLHFGDFEGAYYGQKYRNNRLGVIDADSLNLRSFHYLITRLRDGKILVGTTYHGQYGDYEGLRSCITFQLTGDYRVVSKTLTATSSEIQEGSPVSIKLTYRRRADRAERRPLFGTTGVVAIRSSEFGDEFERNVAEIAAQVRGTEQQRKRALARFVNQGEMISLNEDDIVGCSAVVRTHGGQKTVYLLGENNFSTRFPLSVTVDRDGLSDRVQVRDEMIRVMREKIMPLLA